MKIIKTYINHLLNFFKSPLWHPVAIFHRIYFTELWLIYSTVNELLLLTRLCLGTRNTAEDKPNNLCFQRCDIWPGREKLKKNSLRHDQWFQYRRKNNEGRDLVGKPRRFSERVVLILKIQRHPGKTLREEYSRERDQQVQRPWGRNELGLFEKQKWRLLSHVWLFMIPWTEACQAPLSMEFSRQEYWSG